MMADPKTVFFSSICLRLKHLEDTGTATAKVNSKAITYNPDYFLSLTPKQRISLLVHEIYHIVTDSFGRKGDRDHKRWNSATDYANNWDMQIRGFEIKSGWLISHVFEGMSAEEIYNLLPETVPGNELDGDVDEAVLSNEEKQDIRDLVVSAAMHSKTYDPTGGTIPVDVQLFLNKLTKPRLPWNVIMAKYLNALRPTDYSYRKPNKRYWPDVYLPSLISEGIEHVAFAVDASGSVSDDEFRHSVAEINEVIRKYKPKKLSLVIFDDAVRNVIHIKNVKELMSVEFSARGGTIIQPVLDWIAKEKPWVTFVISDGWFESNINQKIKQNIVWLIYGDSKEYKPPFGKTIYYKHKK